MMAGNMVMVYGVFRPGGGKKKPNKPDIIEDTCNESPPKMDTLTIEIEKDLLLQLAVRAHSMKVTLNDLVVAILRSNAKEKTIQ